MPPRGALISVEGINGVGKDHLLDELQGHHPALGLHSLAEFSHRRTETSPGLDRQLLHALIDASDGDYFLRGGSPHAETALLLAIKTHDYDHARPSVDDGAFVVEGRGLHTVAVYQSAILHHDHTTALTHAVFLLELAVMWRPLPDVTVLVTDDPDTAADRATTRDGRPFTAEQHSLHIRAARLYESLASHPRFGMTVLDRRQLGPKDCREALYRALAATQPTSPR